MSLIWDLCAIYKNNRFITRYNDEKVVRGGYFVIMGVSCLKCGYMMRCHYYIDLRIFGLANSDAEKNCWAVTATVFLPPHFLVLVTRTIASNPIVTICIFLIAHTVISR